VSFKDHPEEFIVVRERIVEIPANDGRIQIVEISRCDGIETVPGASDLGMGVI
jgi:hypothetical protein